MRAASPGLMPAMQPPANIQVPVVREASILVPWDVGAETVMPIPAGDLHVVIRGRKLLATPFPFRHGATRPMILDPRRRVLRASS